MENPVLTRTIIASTILVTLICTSTTLSDQSDIESLQQQFEQSPNHNGQRFVNLVETKRDWKFRDYFRMIKSSLFGGETRSPDERLPVEPIDSLELANNSADQLSLYWIGHATVLIEIDGYRLLTDPLFSEKIKPLKFLTRQRFHELPIKLSELPKIDAVLISHDHADHLDKPTVTALAAIGTDFFVPLGLGALLEKWGLNQTQITEMDWYDSTVIDVSGVTLIATPARHLSGRGFSKGANQTLWASWIISGRRERLFFGGDTGYFSQLREIGEVYGPFTFALLPIGAYDPIWPDIHLTPEEAVMAFNDLEAEMLIPIHWGTFNLSFHDWFEPAERLIVAAEKNEIQYYIPKPGQVISTSELPEVEHWWRKYMLGGD